MSEMSALVGRLEGDYAPDSDRQSILAARDVARRLDEQVRRGRPVDEFLPVVEELTNLLQVCFTLMLASSAGASDPPSIQELHTEARVAFYALRAHLFPDGKT